MRIRRSTWFLGTLLALTLACSSAPDERTEAPSLPDSSEGSSATEALGTRDMEPRCLLLDEECDGYGKCCEGLVCNPGPIARCKKK